MLFVVCKRLNNCFLTVDLFYNVNFEPFSHILQLRYTTGSCQPLGSGRSSDELAQPPGLNTAFASSDQPRPCAADLLGSASRNHSPSSAPPLSVSPTTLTSSINALPVPPSTSNQSATHQHRQPIQVMPE